VRPRTRFLLVFTAFTALAGCAGQSEVVVVDPTGTPVQGATVTPLAMSVNGAPVLTNAAGEAHVDLRAGGQPTRWVLVAKAGFVDAQAALAAKGPLRVTLTPVPAVIE
jgi:hypothetical protein